MVKGSARRAGPFAILAGGRTSDRGFAGGEDASLVHAEAKRRRPRSGNPACLAEAEGEGGSPRLVGRGIRSVRKLNGFLFSSTRLLAPSRRQFRTSVDGTYAAGISPRKSSLAGFSASTRSLLRLERKISRNGAGRPAATRRAIFRNGS